jgi:hypothetical protein
LTTVILMLNGCVPDASHDNPLDPESAAFTNSGMLTGKVLSFYQPYGGISGALVTFQPPGTATWTNSTGAFSIAGIPSGKVSLIASRAGYLTDTVEAEVSVGREVRVDIHLDALPVVGACQVITRKIDQWWPRPVYSAIVSSSVTDPDGLGDVVGAMLQVDTLKLGMTYQPESQTYQVTVNASALPQGSLEWLIGKPLTIIARDKLGASATGDAFSVTRIIQDAPLPTSPTALDTAAASPALNWLQPSLPFSYTYKLELFRLDQGLPTQIWSVSNLPPLLVTYQYPDRLTAGLYFWTISVVDEYGNLSRSKEASFIVSE